MGPEAELRWVVLLRLDLGGVAKEMNLHQWGLPEGPEAELRTHK